MERRALLIGCDLGDLPGVATDLIAFETSLRRFEFDDIRRCEGTAATRQGILAAWEALTLDTQPGDAIVVYYAGHGSRIESIDMGERPARAVQRLPDFILPSDFFSGEDFRGITEWELSLLLKRLTSKTPNVAVVMDCCHAGEVVRKHAGMVRRGQPRSQGAPGDKRVIRGMRGCSTGFAAHLATLRAQGVPAELEMEANANLVRLLACARREPAYEGTNREGDPCGLVTDALCQALSEAEPARVTWHAIGQRVREIVSQETCGVQNPRMEGPRQRLLFSLQEERTTGILAVSRHVNRLTLNGGKMLGLRRGDRYQVVVAGRPRHLADAEIGQVTATDVHALWADTSVVFTGSRTRQDGDLGALAYPLEIVRPRMLVEVRGDSPAREPLLSAVSLSPLLQAAAGAHQGAVVRCDDSALYIDDSSGNRWFARAWSPDREGVRNVVATLERLAHARNTVALATGDDTHGHGITIEWGKVIDGSPHPLPLDGAALRPGDRVYVEVRNQRAQSGIYVSIYDVGVTGQVALLSRLHASGHYVGAGRAYTLGHSRDEALEGFLVDWSPEAAVEAPRAEHFLVFLSSAPVDLRPIETTWREPMTTRDAVLPEPDDWSRIVSISFALQPPRDAAVTSR